MKKTILNAFLGAIIFSSTCLTMFYIFIKARQTTNPWLTDSSPTALYVNNWETLTAAKWNTLVDKKGLKDLTLISCYYRSTTSPTGRTTLTWTTALCWWNLPKNYTKCFIANNMRRWIDWNFNCNLETAQLRSSTASNSIGCSYLCRNE